VTSTVLVFFVVMNVFVVALRAQDRFEAGAQFVAAHSSEFDSTDKGIGVRFTWMPSALIGADAEVNFFPTDFGGRAPFSRSRMEGLFGVTVGPRLGPLRPFAKLRPGFLNFRGQPTVCILIFPPPLSCQLAAGRTLFALDVGGGVQLFTGGRTTIRVDAGDRVLKYPGPSFRTGGVVSQEDFYSHDFRVSAGAGVRF
jgi:hypothetical protein